MLCTIRESVLHSITLLHTALYSNVIQFNTVLSSAVCCAALYYTVTRCTLLERNTIQYSAQLCSLLCCTAILCIVLQFPTQLLLLLSRQSAQEHDSLLCLMVAWGSVGIVRLAMYGLSKSKTIKYQHFFF